MAEQLSGLLPELVVLLVLVVLLLLVVLLVLVVPCLWPCGLWSAT